MPSAVWEKSIVKFLCKAENTCHALGDLPERGEKVTEIFLGFLCAGRS